MHTLVTTVVQHTQSGMMLLSAEADLLSAKIVFANGAFCEPLGYNTSDLQGQRLAALLPDTQKAQLPQSLTHEFRIRTALYQRDKSELQVEWHIVPILDDEQKPAQYVIVQQVIALRKAAERHAAKEDAVRDSEAFLRTIINNNADGIIILDGSGIVSFVNSAAETLFGRTAEELVGEAFGFPVMVEEPTEINLLRKNGDLIYVEMRIVSTVWKGEAVYVAALRDVSERRRSEEKLRQALMRTQDLYAISSRINRVNTLDEVLDAVLSASYLKQVCEAALLIFDEAWGDKAPERYQVAASWKEGEGLLPVIEEALLLKDHPCGHLFQRSAPVYVEDKRTDSRLNEDIRAALREVGVRSVILYPLETSGKWYGTLLLYFKAPNRWSEEDDRHIHGLIDQAAVAIDNIRLLAAEAKARRAAEKADGLKLKFLAMISHELRTPLTSIKGFATTLLAEDVQWDSDSQKDFLNIISQESDKLTDLIEQLLDLSRLEAGTLSITVQRQDFTDVFGIARKSLEIITPNHKLHVSIPDNLPALMVDPRRICQVLINLVGNAATYSPAGTQITINAEQRDKLLQVSVSDEGPGIPPEERETVFQAFQQAENNKGDGAGLGLAICKGMIEAHDGKIWIESADGGGARVCFTLPVIG